MKIKIRSNNQQLEIYRERLGVMIYSALLATISLAMGVWFVYLGLTEAGLKMFLFGGPVFIVVGLALAINMIRLNKRIRDSQGHPLFVANTKGISIAPLLNMPLRPYPWHTLSRIVLAKKLLSRQGREKGYSWNLGLVFFKAGEPVNDIGLIARSKQQVWLSPQGMNISTVDLPKGELARIKLELDRLSGRTVPVEVCREFHLDYNSLAERCQA